MSVSSETEFRDALADLSDDESGAHTIDITDSFEWLSTNPEAFPPMYSGTQALTINGNGHTISFGSEAYGGLLLYSGSQPLTISALTVEGFDDDGVIAVSSGADVSIIDSAFTDNAHGPGLSGGVIGADDSAVTISSSTFTRNTARAGGAVEAAAVTVSDSEFYDNTASNGNGGAIAATSVDVDITDSMFEGNTATEDGGAVHGWGSIEVTGSSFDSNKAANDGGAVWGWGGVDISSSTFISNEAALEDGEEPGDRRNGGAVYSEGSVSIDRSTFSGNIARLGGAVYTDAGEVSTDVVVVHSTFDANVATVAGGAVRSGQDVGTFYSTFSANESPGSGAHINAPYSGALATTGTVYSDALGGDGCYVENGSTSGGVNFDDDGTCTGSEDGTDGDFGFEGDAMLEELADNGGPTHTLLPADGSPLIDAIELADCPEVTDQRGVTRPAGDGCDVGAVEVLPAQNFTIATDDGEIAGTVHGAECVTDESWAPASDYPGAPAGLAVPFGVAAFSFCVPGDGWVVDVELDLPRPVTSLWKVTGSDWNEIDSATFDGTVASYSIVAGGPLDESSDPGLIEDPVAPGILSSFTG